MIESACQRNGVSCGSCCGIFNLKHDSAGDRAREARTVLLEERRRRFDATVRFDEPESYLKYRLEREEAEAAFDRHNPEIYVCPFFGPIRPHGSGCMIHPGQTGRDGTQNHSFYGASICQTYDCGSKERDEARGNHYSRLLALLFHGEDYARLMADQAFHLLLCSDVSFYQRAEAALQCEHRGEFVSSLVALARARLSSSASQAITSFEPTHLLPRDPEGLFEFLFGDEGDRMALKGHWRGLRS